MKDINDIDAKTIADQNVLSIVNLATTKMPTMTEVISQRPALQKKQKELRERMRKQFL